MNRKNELSFLVRILGDLNIRTRMWPRDREEVDTFDFGMRKYVDPAQRYQAYIKEYSANTDEHTLYTLKDTFGWNYLFFMHPGDGSLFMLIGPFFHERPERKWILSRAERFSIDRSRMDGFIRLYEKVPVIQDRDMLLSVISTYLGLLWETDSFPILPLEIKDPIRVTAEEYRAEEPDRLSRTERKYRQENELMSAVRAGDSGKVADMLRRFDFTGIARRSSDPVRNLKNYAVIMNTLLRKAAESGSVHPVYLDRVSDMFAREIEDSRTSDSVERILCLMPERYVSLVRNQGMKDMPPLIRKGMMMTALNISKPLTLRDIAEELGVNPSYLSRLWRKETGKTLTEYIRNEKMKSAEELLSYTDLRIETVAELTGFPDICYFSRIYRRVKGRTPSESRKEGCGRII